MGFAGKVWRLIVGVKDALVLLFMLLFFGGLYALLSASPKVGAADRGALVLDLSGAIVEQPAPVDPLALLSGRAETREYRLRDVTHAIDAAADDDRVKAIALDLDLFLGGGQVTLASVGEALDRFRKSGKPVLAFATAYTDDSYQLAAHADEVWLDPLGGAVITGPGGTNLYYKGLLDKLGVTANVYKVGTYKSAVEPYIRNDMSPEARRAIQAVADALWQSWLAEVRRVRPKAQLPAFAVDMPAYAERTDGDFAKAALAAGLIDRLGDRIAFGNRLAKIVGAEDKKIPGSFKAIPYDNWAETNPAGESGGRIGILTVAGDIVDGEAVAGTAGAETIVGLLQDGLAERNLKALVIRVDSPGGSVFASERIRQAILAAKARGLPVVVSMGSVAASGGYWISTAGDFVMAEPATITGSIGVFGILPSFQGTLDKLGLGADGIKTTPLSGEPDLLRGPSPEADRLIQASVEDTYRRFISIVAKARKLPPARVAEIAEGRVWDGGTARQLGLVDRFGSLDDAVAEAARRAHLDPETAEPAWLDREPSFLESLVAAWATEEEQDAQRDMIGRIAARSEMLAVRAVADARRLLAAPGVQARCLECTPVGPARPTPRERRGLAALLEPLLP